MKTILVLLLSLIAFPAMAEQIMLDPQDNPSLLFAHVRKYPANIYGAKLSGDYERTIREGTKCTGDIVMVVKELKRYSETCSRLGFVIVAQKTPTTTGVIDFMTKVEIDICNDGTIPNQILDLEKIAQGIITNMPKPVTQKKR